MVTSDERRVGLCIDKESEGDLQEEIRRARMQLDTSLRRSRKQLVGHVVSVDVESEGVGAKTRYLMCRYRRMSKDVTHPTRSTNAPSSAPTPPTVQAPCASHRLT